MIAAVTLVTSQKITNMKLTKPLLIAASALMMQSVVYAQYCTPAIGTLSSCGDTYGLQIRINRVKTTGAATNNINNINNACSGYTYYTGAANTVAANAGDNISITVNTQVPGALPAIDPIKFPYRVVVWVDWNNDKVFDNTLFNPATQKGELMAISPNSGYTNGDFTAGFSVPLSAKNTTVRMRVRAGTRSGAFAPYVPPNAAAVDPCTVADFVHGEVEDYDFQVVNPCVAPTDIKYSNLTDKTATISWKRKHNAIMYEYWVSQIQAVPDPGTGNYTTTDTFVKLPDAAIPLQCGAKYYVYVRSICDSAGKPQILWEQSAWTMSTFTMPECCYTPKVTMTNISSTSAIASWNPVPTVQQYEYVVSPGNSAVPTIGGTITTATSVFLTGLAPGKETYFYLRAHCSPTPRSDWGLDSFLTQPATGVSLFASKVGFEITAYPNPAKDKLNLYVTNGVRKGKANVDITDLTGKVVKRVLVDGGDIILNIADMPSAFYIIRYSDDENATAIRFRKE